MQNQTESLLDLIVLLYKWKKQILIATFLMALIAAGLSLLLPNYYKANTIFYPASPDLANPSPLGNLPDEKNIYGNDHDIDRLLSIARSNEIFNYLIDSFNLYEHYEIDPDKAKAKYKLLLKLDKLYESKKTKFDAIQLSIEDKDPELSKKMTNATRDKIEEIAQGLIKKIQKNLIDSDLENVSQKQKLYKAIGDSLYYTRKKYNIFNTVSQGEAFGTSMVDLEGKIENYNARLSLLKTSSVPIDSIELMQAKLSGYQKQYQTLRKNIKDYNSGYPNILRFERELKDVGDQLNLDKERLKQLKAIHSSKINAIHIIEKAETPVIKSRPKRSFLVIGTAMLSFILMCLWVIIQDQLKKHNWRSKINEA